jgi:kexin
LISRGETAIGDWSIIVKDSNVNEHSGTFIDWRLNLWGEAIDGAKQKLHPLPDEHDDDHPYEDAPVATTSIVPAPTKTAAPANPDDHHDRPVNAKPQPSATKPTVPVADEKKPTSTTSSEAEAASPSSTDSGYISSYLPTFGASKRTQIWIYASLAMIITFFIGLGVYFQLQRVKRRRTTAHDDYEFEMIEDEDEMQPMTGAPGRTQRRGGELYNAFAGESDEEMFSDDDEPYRDGSGNLHEKDGEDGTSHGGPLSEKP